MFDFYRQEHKPKQASWAILITVVVIISVLAAIYVGLLIYAGRDVLG